MIKMAKGDDRLIWFKLEARNLLHSARFIQIHLELKSVADDADEVERMLLCFEIFGEFTFRVIALAFEVGLKLDNALAIESVNATTD